MWFVNRYGFILRHPLTFNPYQMPIQKTIVYVEDDYDDQDLLQAAFPKLGDHSLVTLANSTELFSYLEKGTEEICLLVLDINLPFLDGIQILQFIKESPQYREIPVVVLTTGANSPQMKELRALGVEVLQKPYDFLDLEGIADKLLQYCLHNSSSA
ncbi:MAG: response regulator [Chitinophagaceae bacterium]|nr:MAG: response regulator [Chitinophagaceae bacterium]